MLVLVVFVLLAALLMSVWDSIRWRGERPRPASSFAYVVSSPEGTPQGHPEQDVPGDESRLIETAIRIARRAQA